MIYSPLVELTVRGFREDFAPAWLPASAWSTLRLLGLDAGSSRGQFTALLKEVRPAALVRR